MSTLAIVIPTYNEAGNIDELLTALRDVSVQCPEFKFEVLIVDDSSPDGTAARAKDLQGELGTANFSIDVEIRATKDGLGRAYIHGFTKVLNEARANLIMQMDADLSHNPAYIPDMLRRSREGVDLVVASRYVLGGGTPDWGWHRKLLSRAGNFYIRTLLDSTLTDYTGAFCIFSRELLTRIDVGSITASGYGFQIELKHRAAELAKRVVEVPIIFMDRRNGESKIPKSTLVKNFVLVAKMRFGKSQG